jgi:hypothetical protein
MPVEKQKMQNVKFQSITEFLAFLPPEELEVVEFLRQLVYDCIPDAAEKLAYNVPYFKRHKNICFIWPASVLWGKQKTYEGVRFGFACGYLLTDEVGYLNMGDRKFVSWRDFIRIEDIDVELLQSYLYEAVILDENNARVRRLK